jgi:hypothetical protein
MIFNYVYHFVLRTLLMSGLLASACGVAAAQSTVPAAPPRLSMKSMQYFAKHPNAWQQLMARLPRIQAGPAKARSAGSPWQPVTATSPASSLSAPLLLTDGTVLVQETCSSNWYKLTPDINGSYTDGSWSAIAPLPSGYAPLYFASQILPDGRLIINGGEYNFCSPVWTTLGAIYDPLADSWTPVAPPSGWTTIGDAESVVLANGTYMLASCCDSPFHAALLNASTLTWTTTGSDKFDVYDEEGWTLLPDGTVMTADGYVPIPGSIGCGTNTERYTPLTGTWASAGASPVQLSDCKGTEDSGGPSYEVGPQVLRADGSVVFFSGDASGAVAGTAIYKTTRKAWSKGPNLPKIDSQNYDLADAPAAWLPTGSILFAASPGLFNAPTHFFEFNTANKITEVADAPNAPDETSYVVNFVVLPTGQILQTDQSAAIEVFTPSGKPNSRWAPVITSLPTTLTHGNSYKVSGRQLNGVSEGASYGDDYQSATSFPLVRITNTQSKHIFYARTSGFSSDSVALKAVSTANFVVPATIETGPSTLSVVTNGIPSKAVKVTVN